MSAPPQEITRVRTAIDEIDDALLKLVAQRRALVAEIFEQKRKLALPLIDPAREQALLLDRGVRAEAANIPRPLVEALFRAILDDSHNTARG